jgi:hypothetical protein
MYIVLTEHKRHSAWNTETEALHQADVLMGGGYKAVRIVFKENKINHTKGPWTTGNHRIWGDNREIAEIKHVSTSITGVLDVTGSKSWASAMKKANGDFDMATAETEANLRLISASPEMFEACKLLMAWDQSDDDVNLISQACSMARVAIAKAEKGE